MYSVHEHLYYIKGRTAPVLEYCVCEAKVTGFFKGGYTEICLVGPNPNGFQTPYRYKLSDREGWLKQTRPKGQNHVP